MQAIDRRRCGERAFAAAIAAAALLLARTPAGATPPQPQAAWIQGDAVVSTVPGARTPLGSVWKLFVYSYLQGTGLQEPPYRCEARQRQADDEYCCDPGDAVGRDTALERSCGPYFDPDRLAIAAPEWERFWRERGAPAWLQRRDAMRPDTDVPVAELLDGLRRISAAERLAARAALLPVATRDAAVLAVLGSGPRYKTWSWHVGDERDGDRVGGAAGWRADGTPFWFAAAGTSRSALRMQAEWLAARWSEPGHAAGPTERAIVEAQPCVAVRYFHRYPIRAVTRADGTPAPQGAMRGRHVVAFASGNRIAIDADGLSLSRDAQSGAARIDARLALDDYVARVVDREGDARETAAARALAVAARSYLLQDAAEADGCLAIDDDSRAQRVAPNPPSAAARAAAAFTTDMVVAGRAVRYHRDEAAPGVLSWRDAVAAGRRGESFESILRAAYPGAALAGADAAADCSPLPQAQAWLQQRQRRWREILRAQPGYEPPGEALRVCQLALGAPQADQRRMTIRVREWTTRDGRVSLIHEYLHLAFREHPSGRDEAFIEQLAQRLADT